LNARTAHAPAAGAAAPGAANVADSPIPRATYRLQLHRGFTFRDAARIAPYLAALGVSHVYCSPFLRARSGSMHGYDIIDHNSLNPEIGSEEDFAAFSDALKRHDLRLMLDVVPNHMAVLGADNAWWLEVLENGQATPYADFFDIDWAPPRADMAGRVLLPVLGGHYGAVLSAGELSLRFDAAEGSFSVHYYQHRFPIDPREYPRLLKPALESLSATAVPADARAELDSLVSAFAGLPARYETGAALVGERSAGKEAQKRRLALLVAQHPSVGSSIEKAVAGVNGRAGDPASLDTLDELLEAQAYRLAYWRVAADEVNYRRFFEINELAALRMEDEAVFEATHRKIFELLRSGAAHALRIDHPDGLFDPAGYFRRLQERYRLTRAQNGDTTDDHIDDTANDTANDLEKARPLYVAIEKIVASFESIPQSWPVQGTTGYRFANLANGLFVDGSAAGRFTRIYQAFVGESADFEETALRAKQVILNTSLASELGVLTNRLVRIARARRDTRDYTLNTLRQALAEVVVAFPVYRSYIGEDISETDRRYIEWAVARARRRSRSADASIFDFIRAVLLAEPGAEPEAGDVPFAAMRMFARKFQQLTAPVTAKGVEDTAFYIYNRLASLNEVGGDPAAFGVSVNAFHGASADRAAHWPHAMLATSTHDSKRSEDVRARIDVLSEVPAAWRLQLRRWARMNRSRRREVDGRSAPSRNDEYLLYQTLVGSFPPELMQGAMDAEAAVEYRQRIRDYMLKAAREAKVHTSWINPNKEYEAALGEFAEALLTPGEHNLFLDDFRDSLAPVAWAGLLNSLSLMLIKYTSPGIPDCYQGNELWDFSLVDPDNRRPVDYARREAALGEVAAIWQDAAGSAQPDRMHALLERMQDGLPKLHLIRRLLALRREQPTLFERGDYTPLKASGAHAAHVVGYARRHGGRGLIALAGRLFMRMGIQAGEQPCGEQVWQGTRVELPFLPDGTVLRNLLSGENVAVAGGGISMAAAWEHFPGAALEFELPTN